MEPTQEFLNEALNYNPETGIMTWKHRPLHHFLDKAYQTRWNSRLAGKVAGCEEKPNAWDVSYWGLRIDGKRHRVHRLAWCMTHGVWPDKVDHQDGNGLNNRLSNLRATTNSGNMRNASLRHNNKSGYHGVIWNKARGKWVARIRQGGKYDTVYYGDDLESAIAARKQAEVANGYHPNHGRPCTV